MSVSEKHVPTTTKKSDPINKERPLKTTEEFDCERRGYKLTKNCLGTGAYAKVKLAYVTNAKLEKDKRLADELREKGTNKVAIKIISRKHAPKEYIKKFMPREIETLHATYRSPNVTQLYETFRTESRVYLIMEYASKGDLLEYINSRSSKNPGIGEEKAKMFFKQLVAGILHCHRRNVVHRDLKCENILIDDEEETVKISDFGFATRFPTNKQNLLETFCGSYAYAAPEILQAEKYDGKIADIWSLGVILFAMVNGRLPFNDRDIRTLLEQTKSKPRFSSRVQVSNECQDLVTRILTADLVQRATLQDILRHEWMQIDDTTSSNKTLRGIPDGKSNEVVGKETIENPLKYNINKNALHKPYTQRVLNRERVKEEVIQEPTAVPKLLHTRRDTPPCKNKDAKEDVDVLSKYWEERRKSEKSRKHPVANILPNRYNAEPIITKIAFRTGTSNTMGTNSVDTAYRLSPQRAPPPQKTGTTTVTDRILPGSAKQVKEIKCTLPPVLCETQSNARSNGKQIKSNSAPAQGKQRSADELGEQRRTKTRQSATNATKQHKPKPMQNILFNNPGVNIEVVNLQRNWQKLKQASSSKTSKIDAKLKRPGNIELTYYTLSGKEVSVRGDKGRNLKETKRVITA